MNLGEKLGLGRSTPTPDEVMAANQVIQDAQALPSMDPLSAAQINRTWDSNDNYFGIANLTVDNKRNVEEFRARLRGYSIKRRYDSNTGVELEAKLDKYGEPMMNDEGINHLCGILESFMSKGIMLSNIPEKMFNQIDKWCRVFMRTVAVQLAVNSEKWSVDRSRRDSIPSEMTLLLKMNMLRAYEDGERKKIYPGQKNITTNMLSGIAQSPPQNKMSRFSW